MQNDALPTLDVSDEVETGAEQSGQKGRLSKWLSIILPLLLGFFLIIYKYNEFTPAELSEMKSYFRTADYFYILLSMVISLFSFLSRAHRWKYSLNHMGYHTKFNNNLLAVCIAYFVNLTIPRSGEISRALILKRYENIPFDKAFGTIVAERIVDLVIFMLFAVAAMIFQFNILKQFIVENIPLEKLAWLAAAGIITFLVFIGLWFYSGWKIVATLKGKVSGLTEGFMSIFLMPNKWAFLLHSLFIWFTYLLTFYITIFALPETTNIGFGAIITGFVFGSLAIGFTNSGFGAYPLLVAEIFLLYGVPDTAGTAFGWLAWISQTILIVILGLISFILLPIINRNK